MPKDEIWLNLVWNDEEAEQLIPLTTNASFAGSIKEIKVVQQNLFPYYKRSCSLKKYKKNLKLCGDGSNWQGHGIMKQGVVQSVPCELPQATLLKFSLITV